MSDTADYSSLTAGNAAVIATGTGNLVNFGALWLLNPSFSGIPAWVRSLLIIVKVTNTVGSMTISGLTITGSPSGLEWFNPSKILNDSGGPTIANNGLSQPQYAPFYGILDNQAILGFTADRAGTLTWTVIGLPDADIMGTNSYPLAVTNSTSQVANNAGQIALDVTPDPNGIFKVQGIGLGAGTGIGVVLEDTAGNQQGTTTHPLGVDIASGPGSAAGTPMFVSQTAGVGPHIIQESRSWQVNPVTVATKTAVANPAGSGQMYVVSGSLAVRNETGAGQVVNLWTTNSGTTPYSFDTPAGGLQIVDIDPIYLTPNTSLLISNNSVNTGLAVSGWFRIETQY